MGFLDKKEKGIARGPHRVGSRALFKKILTFLLTFCILFSSFVTPAYAGVRSLTPSYFSFDYTGSGILSYTDNNLPISVSSSSVLQKNVTGFTGQTQEDYISLYKGDVVTVSLVLNNGKASRYTGFDESYCIFFGVEGDNYVEGLTYNAATSTIVFDSLYIKKDCTLQFLDFGVSGIHTSSPNSNFAFYLTDIKIDISTESQGVLNSIKEWFSSLFELLTSKFSELGSSIKNIGSSLTDFFSELKTTLSNFSNDIKTWFNSLTDSIGSFFTNLTNSIKDWFTELKNNLSTWFSNIGNWFSDLGNKISTFFDTLWNNFKSFFDEIGETIRNWWQSIVDFFHSLFVPEDGYFDTYKQEWEDWAHEHFALFYDCKGVLDDIFIILEEDLFYDNHSLLITIPEIVLPVFDIVILNEYSLDIGHFYANNTSFAFLYSTYRVIVQGFFGFMLVKFGIKTFSEVLTGTGDLL